MGNVMHGRASRQRALSRGLVVLGIAIVAVGTVAAVRDWNLVGTGPYVAAGVLLVALGAFHDRLTGLNVEAFGSKFGLLFAEFSADAGSVVAVEVERLDLVDLVVSYQLFHGAMRQHISGEARIKLQDALIEHARQRTLGRPPRKGALQRALTNDSGASRCIALGIAAAHPDLVDPVRLARGNVLMSKSGNEQFHALKLLLARVSYLDSAQAAKVESMVRKAPYIDKSQERKKRTDELLAHLQEVQSR